LVYENSHRLLELIELMLVLPIAVPSISWVTFPDEVHTSTLRTVENTSHASLIHQELADFLVLARHHDAAPRGRNEGLLIVGTVAVADGMI
jgi:hypothetical protein